MLTTVLTNCVHAYKFGADHKESGRGLFFYASVETHLSIHCAGTDTTHN